ncbi:MAG: hypothetical protein GY833_21920 [Aestuariibacter sp.]|nr:hypothetical protein [Aestuariibacter sp.]
MIVLDLLLTGVSFFATGIAFWVYMAISLVILFALYSDDVKALTKSWGVLVVVLAFGIFAYGNPTLNAWYAENLMFRGLLTLGAYILVGFFVALINWGFMMSRYKAKAREFKADFDKQTKFNAATHDYVAELNEYIYSKFSTMYKSELKGGRLPQVFQESRLVEGKNVNVVKPKVMPAYIMNWWGMWPFAIFYTAYDPLVSLFEGLYNACAGLFTGLRDRIAGDVTKL